MKIYHNPRCSKSREGLAILEASKVNFETIHYIETPISKEELIYNKSEEIIDTILHPCYVDRFDTSNIK